MSESNKLAVVIAIIAEAGYEVSEQGENLLSISDPESNVTIRGALEEDLLYLTVPLMTVDQASVNRQAMRLMLAADNGISTSGFQLYEHGNGQVVITLNNFCKLLDLQSDDRDDILACLSYLLVDIVQAHALLSELISCQDHEFS